VPEGWAAVTVRSLFELKYGKALKEEVRKGGDVAVFGSNGIVGSHNVPLGKGPVVLIGRKGSVGAVHLHTGSFWAIDTTYFLDDFRGLDPRYVAFAFRYADLSKLESSSAIPGLSRELIYDESLLIPPLAEQKRIVAKVEELLASVNAARERLARVPAILKRFRQAVLGAACDGRLTAEWREAHPNRQIEVSLNALAPRLDSRPRRGVPESVDTPEVIDSLELPESWGAFSVAQLLRLGALLDVKDGNHGANHPKVADFTAAGLPFITAAQVRGFQIDYDGAYKVSGKPLEKLRVGFARPGDAILTHKGSVGRSALNDRECVLTPQTTYYRPDVQIINPGYLVFLFAAPQFYSQLAQVMSQTTRDFVPIREQYRLFLILPPKDEQDEIFRRVEALFKLADAIEKRVAAATARSDKVMQAILAKAFRGELVPTEADLARGEGRGYESAGALLERLSPGREHMGEASKRTLVDKGHA
jgi:type I restriction enzyme S subunit